MTAVLVTIQDTRNLLKRLMLLCCLFLAIEILVCTGNLLSHTGISVVDVISLKLLQILSFSQRFWCYLLLSFFCQSST